MNKPVEHNPPGKDASNRIARALGKAADMAGSNQVKKVFYYEKYSGAIHYSTHLSVSCYPLAYSSPMHSSPLLYSTHLSVSLLILPHGQNLRCSSPCSISNSALDLQGTV